MNDISDFVSFGLLIGSDEIKSIEDFQNFYRDKSFHKLEKAKRDFYRNAVQTFINENAVYRFSL